MDTEGLACVDRSGTPCVLDETCDPRATGERCVSGRCRRECFSDRDCRNDFRCSEGLCHPPVDGMDASTDASETDAPSPSACGGGPLANVGDLSTGRLHACAVTDLGAGSRVWCWGAIPGVLGGAPCARQMTSLATLGVIDVAAGGDHTCARTAAGEVLCAGGVFTSDAATFVSVATDSAEIEAGASHTCSRTNAGVVECFGSGAFGVLGTGSSTPSSVPVPVTVVDTSLPFGLGMGRAFSCAIGRGDRQVACWGDDSFGQLGNGGGTLLVGVEEVDGGGEHTCARTTTTLYCWGHNSAGQLGLASPMMRSTRDVVPVPAGGLRGIAAGNFHTCVDIDGDAHCWGLGRAIDGSAGNVLTPSRVLVGIHGLDAGDDYTCGIDGTGHVVCLGGNSDGELGDGTSVDRYVPTQVLTE
jgi:alpha-tubulin suppressor-like RCC1 family protein